MSARPKAPHRHERAKFLADGGMETTLIFHEGLDLPLFAAFTLMRNAEGRGQIERYFRPYLELARDRGVGFVLDTPTWRASPDWGERLGFGAKDLASIDRDSILLASDLRAEYDSESAQVLINGVVGPRGDGYQSSTMSIDDACVYHAPQVEIFARAGADRVSAITMTTVEEATGIALAALESDIPSVISFTVETDGKLPGGFTIGDAIAAVEDETDGAPLFYMINCAHPSHFEAELGRQPQWLSRIGGIRANASTKSHAELDNSTELDEGDPAGLAERYRRLMAMLPNLQVLGGCCGTDHRHIAAIADACVGKHVH
ncbi:MAG TPA: homocysteine S-methyltransferase family protein [Devosiaceae bacterium]|nr:homocysteine S-methyltransferase family protein [Devosiaceae bacterium]